MLLLIPLMVLLVLLLFIAMVAADITIFASHFFHDYAMQNSIISSEYRNVQIIPNFMMDDIVHEDPQSLIVYTKVLAYYGRIDALRGVYLIMDALEEISKKGENIKEFHRIGDFNTYQKESTVSHATERIF